MKSTFEIIEETAKLFNRFASELPKYYMQEVFGKQDEELAEKCLQAPKHGVSAVYRLIVNLKYDERKAIASYINRVNK
jgi:monomeric isocitrate dehydrogenase